MLTITDGVTSVHPLLVEGLPTSRRSQNIVNQPLAASAPIVTVRPAGYRTGTITVLCADLTQAIQLEALLAKASIFEITDTELAELDMVFVTTGDIRKEIEPETREYWRVITGFQEVKR